MNITQIKALVALARERNLTRAAETIGISQPAISHQLRKLQNEYGFKLYRRAGRFTEFTEMGRELVVKARGVLDLLEDMKSTLEAAGDLRAGFLSIGFSCHHYVMAILAGFMQRYPGIQVKAQIGDSVDLMEQVLSCGIDIAAVTATGPEPRLYNNLFSRQRMVLFVEKSHPWAGRQRLPVEMLHNQRMVTWHRTSMTRKIFVDRVSAQGIRPRIVLELDNWETIREAVAAGLGFGIVLEDEFTPDPRVCNIDLTGVDVTAEQYLICMPEFKSLRPVQAFFQMAAEIQQGRLQPSECCRSPAGRMHIDRKWQEV